MTHGDRQHAPTGDGSTNQLAHEELDCSLSVNAVLARYPSTVHVFNRFGLDTCCGGVLRVDEAARAHGIDRGALCGALKEALFV